MDAIKQDWRESECPHCGARATGVGHRLKLFFSCGSANPGTRSNECFQREPLWKEVKRLRAWQRQTMQVESEWTPEALAQMLGAKIGDHTRAVMQREIPQLVSRVSDLLTANAKLKSSIRELLGLLEGGGSDAIQRARALL